ncbi:hypothetical protein ACTXT7_017604, partial [Hymenolepis weldensis]
SNPGLHTLKVAQHKGQTSLLCKRVKSSKTIQHKLSTSFASLLSPPSLISPSLSLSLSLSRLPSSTLHRGSFNTFWSNQLLVFCSTTFVALAQFATNSFDALFSIFSSYPFLNFTHPISVVSSLRKIVGYWYNVIRLKMKALNNGLLVESLASVLSAFGLIDFAQWLVVPP